MVSILTTIFGWILAKVFGLVKQNQTEKKYVESVKENFELRAQNAGLWKRKEVEKKEENIKEEWEKGDEEQKYEILKRDFSDLD
ncbi:MAG: hypothetical protein DHS20C13_02930 [Thermodesulfobacteriota bacterium]|nr:MAG: hypothetical protein DHS20C13_02930 [Thermodesulfobacteriota bacterium]